MSIRSQAFAAALALAVSLPAAHAARADAPKGPPDLSGTWRLDPSKSDLGRRPGMGRGEHGGGMFGGGGGRHGGWGGGGWGGRGGGFRRGGGGGEGAEGQGEGAEGAEGTAAGAAAGGGGQRAGGMHMGWLPAYLRVAQTNAEIDFADSAGAEVREIALVAAPYDSAKAASKVQRDPGEWTKDKLTVERLGPNELKIREELSLEDDGRTLVIKTHAEGPNGNGRDMKRVYRRVTA